MRIPNCPSRCAKRASAVAVSGRRVDMQHRPEGRTGPWLAPGYAMCFRCERNGTTIRLHRHDQAPWRRYRSDPRGKVVLGCFCAKQPNRPRHAKRKLRRCQRQRCRRPRSRRQGVDRRIPAHDNVAAVVGRRPDWNQSGVGRSESHSSIIAQKAHGMRSSFSSVALNETSLKQLKISRCHAARHPKMFLPFSSNTNTKLDRQNSPALLNSTARTLA